MTYSIKVQQISRHGTPVDRLASYEGDTETEALALATSEIDVDRSGPQRIATVTNASSKLVLTHAGRAKGDGHDGR